jgi:hypothetical protein
MRPYTRLALSALLLTACDNASPTSPGMPGGAQQDAAARNAAKPPSPAPKGWDLPACGERANFDALPVALEDIRALRPLGYLSPPSQVFPLPQSAFVLGKAGDAHAVIKFPAKGWVTSIVEQTLPGHVYTLSFAPCRDLKAVIGHVGTLAGRLATEMAKATPSCQDIDTGGSVAHRCDYDLHIEVASGDVLGQSGDTGRVDFSVSDARLKPAAFVEPAHYGREWLFAAAPAGYFTTALRTSLEGKLASDDGQSRRTVDPKSGAYVQDVAGTAQGNWFLPARNLTNSSDTGAFLALVHDYVDPAQPLLSVGNAIPGLAGGLYAFTPVTTGAINRDFSDVKPDAGVFCFDGFSAGRSAGGLALADPGGAVLIAMPGPRALHIEKAAGKKCAELGTPTLSDTAAVFER